jgi:cystathionine beta-lyase
LIDTLKLFGIGFSWGGFESLVIPFDPASIRAHRPLPAGAGVRLSIGLEDAGDLIADLAQGLGAL